MSLNLIDNLVVLYFKYRHLSYLGNFSLIITVSSVVIAFAGITLTEYDNEAVIIGICGVIFVLLQLFYIYVSQLRTSFYKSENSENADSLYNITNIDLTPEFEVITLPSKVKISHSLPLNTVLINDEEIRFSKNKDYENIILKKWKNEREKQSKFLIFKANDSGRLFNESKVALLSNLYSLKKYVEIGKTSYFTSLVTNEASGKILINKTNDSVTHFDNMIPIVNGNLLDIPSSRLSNHIGVTLLGITKDNNLIFWSQNSKAQQNVNSLVASGSGSLDWRDLTLSNAVDLINLVKYGMTRELVEECNLDNNAVNDININDCKVIGYFRWLERGGKPEFVGICNIPVSTALLYPDTKEVSSECNGSYIEHPPIHSMSELFTLCERYLSDSNIKLGVSLEYLLYTLSKITKNKSTDEYSIIKKLLKLEE